MKIKNFYKKFKTKNKCYNERAFTLIELMVVIAISVLIGGALFVNLRAGGRSMDLNSSAEKLAGVIKQAQMMALSGKQIDSIRPAGGYGVYFDVSTDPDSYKIFANTNDADNYEYDAGDMEIQTITLPEQVSMIPSDLTPLNPVKSIIFKPPYGPIYVSSGSGGTPLTGTNRAQVLLQHLEANFYAYVRINSQGEIDVRKTD